MPATPRRRLLGTTEDPLVEYSDLLEFDDRVHYAPDGRFAVHYNGAPIDFRYEHRDAPVTVVFFHGAVQKEVSIPWFLGEGVMSDVDANWLAISDPTLAFSRDLKLAWYAGSEAQPRLQDAIEMVVRRIATITDVGQHLIFFGTSGGGFAALEMSHRFPGSLALPVNPQTALRNHREGTTGEYLDVAWPKADRNLGALPDTVRTDLVELYSAVVPNTVAYMQNSWDSFHISMHALPFFRISPNESTIIPGPASIYLRLGAWGDPAVETHVPPAKDEIARVISGFAQTRGQWSSVMEPLGFTQDTHSSEIRGIAEQLNSATDHMV